MDFDIFAVSKQISGLARAHPGSKIFVPLNLQIINSEKLGSFKKKKKKEGGGAVIQMCLNTLGVYGDLIAYGVLALANEDVKLSRRTKIIVQGVLASN